MGGRGSSSGIGGGGSGAKIGDEVHRAEWFNFDLPSYAMQPYNVKIIGESDSGKAWKVDIETESLSGEHDLYFTRFMPKSAVVTKSQMEAQRKAERKRYEQGKQKYSAMVKFAKENGVKGVREGLRKETILEKIKKAGLSYKY